MQVGHIPSLTWNRLEVNEGRLEEPKVNIAVETRFETLPEGITKQTISYAEANQWLSEHAPEEKPEAVVAGKMPIYHPQRFGTGLGQEYDDFLEESKTETELFEVADHTQLKDPIRWSIHFTEGSRAATAQIIHVGEGSSLTLIMNSTSDPKASGLAAISTRIVLEKGAKLFLIKAQTLGDGYDHLDDTGISAAEDGSVRMIQAELGGRHVFIGTQGELVGNHSTWESHMGYLGRNEQQIDINYNVIQRGRKTNSVMTFDGVLDDKAQKAFRGTIDFRKGSAGSKGDEQENVLLLSDDMINKTLPVILCEEEDVEGRHGASIGKLDEEMLFYMATRGISEAQAEQIMVRARLGAVDREIPDPDLRRQLTDYIETAFAGGKENR